ncbi:hypothetical protein NEISUBOT_04848 [Neisseria subflava NJ9703]|uniref:Uncharacterized protein n=1 Tax=Neisseria subflava NJ9703 TaxID=546268 RepID=A0A9W5IQ76_NEISU|nr:hypothetical protein NEISUBOT_04848 [Neisseria subflava NJ9703]
MDKILRRLWIKKSGMGIIAQPCFSLCARPSESSGSIVKI